MLRTGLTLLLLVLGIQSVSAGQLDPELANQISGKSADQTVRVWIQLPRTEDLRAFKANLASQSASLAVQHRIAMQHFITEHASAQRGLLSYLRTLPKGKQPMNIKSHWLVNMVEAEVPISDLNDIASRPDVEMVYAVPRITAITPVETTPAPAEITSVQPNLTAINAPAAWAAGYTGTGRLVCSFDTGVDGSTAYLHDNWKGLDGDSAAAWFDPAKQFTYPHSIPNCGYSTCNTKHGTHVMGIMVGHSSTDTIGVAPGAKWISAAVIDIAGTSIIDAFEWAADPDGDPNTISDMPDVINNSWGILYTDCQDLFFNLIDNIEALGVVTIFAAGNEGDHANTIRNPAVRADDSLDCFAVGNVDNSGNINSTSSRGPSTCPGGGIKPNVVAPGTAVISSVPGGTIEGMTGTSMAAPHVSGLVALLRQKNPNATVDQIKTAILTTTSNLGHTLPDNTYGWGMINCLAALNALPPNSPSVPDLRVDSFDHQPISPGDTATGYVWLKNVGSSVNGVMATLIGSSSALTVVDGSSNVGNVLAGATVRLTSLFRVAVSDTVTAGSVLSLGLHLSSAGYDDTLPLYFSIVPSPERTFMTLNSGLIQFSVSDFGTYGFAAGSFVPLNGVGFDYTGLGNDMYEGGLMIGYAGSGNQRVSDGIRNNAGEPDGDFRVVPGGTIGTVAPVDGVTQQTRSAFDDSRAQEPIGLGLVQNSYAYNTDPDRDFVILQYILKNDTNVTLTNLYVGLYTDWDIFNYSSDAGGYDATGQFNWTAYNSSGTLSRYRGVKILQGGTYTAFTQKGSLVYYPANAISTDDGFTEQEKLQSLTSGFIYADSFKTGANDLLQITAARIATMAPGQVDTVAFAFVAGDAFTDIQSAAIEAQAAYAGILVDVGDIPGGDLPASFALHQNYPNPFNPTTTIGFSLPRASRYDLSIYNIVGQLVHKVSGFSKAGEVEIEWDASNCASGIYLYKVTAGNHSAAKKMLLLK